MNRDYHEAATWLSGGEEDASLSAMQPSDDEEFLSQFNRALTLGPLEQSSDYYVRVYEDTTLSHFDPVNILARSISRNPEGSVQLFSGYRGSGKSTELRRLQERLRGQGYHVVLCDMREHIDLSTSLDVADFLMVLAGALGEALYDQKILSGEPSQHGYWPRALKLLKRLRIPLAELGLDAQQPSEADAAGLRQSLREDPVVRDRVRRQLEGHIGPLLKDVRDYFAECLAQFRKRHGGHARLVYLVDSLEQMQGTFTNAMQVLGSVVELFANHADKLFFKGLHVIYTIPPYVSVLHPGLGNKYPHGGILVLPALKVKQRNSQERYEPIYALLEQVVRQRGDWERLLGGNRELLQQIIAASGGHFRDLLRILIEIIRRVDAVPVSPSTVAEAIGQVRSEYMSIPDSDVEWLARIAESNEMCLPSQDKLPEFARFLETSIVLGYRNGDYWYDVHPLVRDVVRKRASELSGQRPAANRRSAG